MKAYLYIILFFLGQVLIAQNIQKVKAPDFEPMNTGTTFYFNSGLNNTTPSYQTYPAFSSVPMGATAEDIMRQANTPRNGPYYPPGATPQQRQQANIAYIQQQMANDPAYNPPSVKNNFTNNALQNQKELLNILNEAHNQESGSSEYWKAPGFASKEKPYYDALNKLKQQLTGQKPISVADAYYEVEAADGNIMLSRQEFKSEIQKTASFALQWMRENNLDPKDNLSLNFAIQKLFSDTLTIGNKKNPEFPDIKPQKHLPYYYDYEDYKAEKDKRSYHVTKGFATGNGQCHILPLMYSCIAEAMGAKCYLSYAPHHSFIQYPDNKGYIHNYEVTTNWEITNQWYKDNLDVTSLAEKNQIYLHPMDRKEIVADAVMDLAFNYRENIGIADEKFLNDCIDFAMNYFPNKDANIYGWLLRSKLTAVELDRLLLKKGIKDVKDIEQIPEAKQLLTKLNSINNKVQALGYTEVDIAAYEQMVEDSKKRHPEIPQKNNLQKRNLFIPTN